MERCRTVICPGGGKTVTTLPEKPASSYLENIGALDHTATRIRAQDRTAAILEFVSLTSYHYDFGIHVKSLNSITSVARRKEGDFAMVFTSGITPYTTDEASGPTESVHPELRHACPPHGLPD